MRERGIAMNDFELPELDIMNFSLYDVLSTSTEDMGDWA